MKKSDLATIVLIAGFTTIVAFVLANVFLGDPNEESVSVKYLDVVSSELDQPDQELFNAQAVNPTVEIVVGSCSEGEQWDAGAGTCVSIAPATDPETIDPEDASTDQDTTPTTEQ